MGSDLSWIHPFWALGLPIAASFPIGWSMYRSLDPAPERVGKGLDAIPLFLCRLLGRREPDRMDWKKYAIAFLAFNAAGGLIWATAFTLLGYLVGAGYRSVENIAGRASEVILALVIVAVIVFVIRRRRRERDPRPPADED